MKAVMISIKPKWVEKIVNGEKTIEVRKTAPKLETPFKCYIYCTKHKEKLLEVLHKGDYCYGVKYDSDKPEFIKTFDDTSLMGYWGIGKVIGEFVCDKIFKIENLRTQFLINKDIALTNKVAKESCLYFDDMLNYLKTKDGYGWHISNLKIYDKPKELGKFIKPCDKSFDYCDGCEDYSDFYGRCNNKITRPPQSWQYIEEN